MIVVNRSLSKDKEKEYDLEKVYQLNHNIQTGTKIIICLTMFIKNNLPKISEVWYLNSNVKIAISGQHIFLNSEKHNTRVKLLSWRQCLNLNLWNETPGRAFVKDGAICPKGNKLLADNSLRKYKSHSHL